MPAKIILSAAPKLWADMNSTQTTADPLVHVPTTYGFQETSSLTLESVETFTYQIHHICSCREVFHAQVNDAVTKMSLKWHGPQSLHIRLPVTESLHLLYGLSI